jgi:mono/diheme cytochrome c family protein
MLDRLFAADDETPQRVAMVTTLSAMIVRSGQDAPIQALFARLAGGAGRPWQRAALMRGAEVAVIGGKLPGPGPQRGRGPGAGATPPCPTCPGARGGPGGDYAFPGVIEAQRAARGARGSGPGLRLNREPDALAALAASGSELAPRAATLLDRIEWPGKPGAAPGPAPLTAAELDRFNRGREVYRDVCAACHQADGRGQERLAPSLVGSALALGAPDIPARILLHGKEGPIGLMPPLGATLSDEDVAAVLTYVRREWGQTGDAVDPGVVASVRTSTKDRTRPWTNDELERLPSAR